MFLNETVITNNNDTNQTNEEEPAAFVITLTMSQIVFFTMSFSLASVLALAGNIVVMIVIIFRRELRHFTNYFFFNLSIADILVLVVCIPTVFQDLFFPDRWIYGHHLCK
jgi:hypothetical protein